ncbi:MAG TPA: hypothetical protein VGN76_13365 [Gemmatimonadales bacterium]|nr:hypothetical protein [Gemmatimonadales bacterium]
MSSIRMLLRNSIDYAGLFPPAGLAMDAAVDNYHRYRGGGTAWALGRFILPASRLTEFERAAGNHLSRNPAGQPWLLGALAGPDPAADLEQVAEFNRRHADKETARIDTLEAKASSADAVRDTMHLMPSGLQAYFEVPIDRDPGMLVAAIGRLGGRAKVRTGGVTRDAFPSTASLLRFLQSCVGARVPFKATAGLHHPLRAEYRLTYEPGSPTGTMFGFLNVFLAAAFLADGMDESEAALLLEEKSPSAFEFDRRGITWRNHRLGQDALDEARRDVIVSFGSCSFTEPIEELQALNILERSIQQA